MGRKVIQVSFNDNKKEQELLQYVEQWGFNTQATIKTIISKYREIEESEIVKPAIVNIEVEEDEEIGF